MKEFNNHLSRSRFFIRQNKRYIFAILALAISTVIWLKLRPCTADLFDRWYGQLIDPILTLGTVMIAFAVWRSEERQEWLASLPKKLNIFYLIEDNKNPGQWKRHVTVINAPLASETDIRAWAQSIGGTILGAERVSITFIGYDISGPHLDKHRRLQYFDVAIFLRRPIDGAMDEQFYLFDRLGKVNGKPKTSTELGEYAEYDCRISLEGQLPQRKS